MPIHDWTKVDAGIFHDFHNEWILKIKHALNAGILPADYYALSEQFAGGFRPDVLTLERVKPIPGPNGTGIVDSERNSAVITLEREPPQVRFSAIAEPEQYAAQSKRVVIRHRSGDDVVAMIEVMSPGNKTSRHALRSVVAKAVDYLRAGVHLLILDLFNPGPWDPQGIHAAIWSEFSDDLFEFPTDKQLTLAAYDAGDVKAAYVEPVAVGDRLPNMPLYLEPGGYVRVGLESTYLAAWEEVPKRWRGVLTTQP